MSASLRVLFVCGDPVGAEMAGLGIRNWELARTLSDVAQVTIAHGGGEATECEGIRLVPFRPHDPRAVIALVPDADLVVSAPGWPRLMRALRRSLSPLVVDLYDPETLETLELLSDRRSAVRAGFVGATLDRLHDALRSGHHFMCASEGQRDLWLGAMLGLRMIDPAAYDRDPSYRSVIDLVPFGVSEHSPCAGDEPGPREALGIPRDAEIVLWNGGLWQWLDAETAIRALGVLRARRPRATLVFMGGAGAHPAARATAERARQLARELGLLGSGVHFNEDWVPYQARAGWLAQADCAVAAAHDHLETRFAFRTRLLDCLWASLPIACTSGDELAERVALQDLGAVTAPEDVAGLAGAMETVLQRGRAAFAPQLRAAAAQASWTRAAAPLRRWVLEAGTHAPSARPLARGALRPPLAHRLREGAYESVGWRVMERSARRRGSG